MEKPISLKLKDFRNDAVSLVNTSGLPLFVVEPILRDVLAAVQTKVEEQYQSDKAAYALSLQKEEQKTVQEENDHD